MMMSGTMALVPRDFLEWSVKRQGKDGCLLTVVKQKALTHLPTRHPCTGAHPPPVILAHLKGLEGVGPVEGSVMQLP